MAWLVGGIVGVVVRGRVAAPRVVAMAGPMLNVRLLLAVSIGGADDLPVR